MLWSGADSETDRQKDADQLTEESILEVWNRSRSNWHWPQLPHPVIGGHSKNSGQYPFGNYLVTIGVVEARNQLYLENLFDHLIVHYIFCPRSLEVAGTLSLSALRGLKEGQPVQARRMVNIFSDIVTDSFRLERSAKDEEKVLLGWKNLARQDLSGLDRALLSFLAEYWGADLGVADRIPEVSLLMQVFSPGVRDRSIWPRQCQQMSRILAGLDPGILGSGRISAVEILRGEADTVPLNRLASELEPVEYSQALSVLGMSGDLKRWYRDQGYSIEIQADHSARYSAYPSSQMRWRISDPLCELDVNYSLGISPCLIPGVTTFKRDIDRCEMVPGVDKVPDLLVVLDSSRSMDGHERGTKTFSATIAAFKASEFAHSQGAELAAINFSDTYLVQPWTRDLNAVEDVLVEYLCGRTSIPGKEILKLAQSRPGCLIICITDTRIQNLYLEWENMVKAAAISRFVLFCIDESGKDRDVERSLGGLGRIYYINRPEDLVALVVETAEKVLSACTVSRTSRAGIG